MDNTTAMVYLIATMGTVLILDEAAAILKTGNQRQLKVKLAALKL